MNIDKKLNELIKLLDKNIDIRNITRLKTQITDKEIALINNYRKNPTIINKKELYDNEVINEYLTCENNINYLIMMINSKLSRRKNCESNKW